MSAEHLPAPVGASLPGAALIQQYRDWRAQKGQQTGMTMRGALNFCDAFVAALEAGPSEPRGLRVALHAILSTAQMMPSWGDSELDSWVRQLQMAVELGRGEAGPVDPRPIAMQNRLRGQLEALAVRDALNRIAPLPEKPSE